MKTILLNLRHAVYETETLTEAVPSTGYLIFQWAYILLIIILFILAIASVFNIFKPKPKVYENDKQDYLSKEHFNKKPAPIDWQEKEENTDFKKYI
jgi:hypothetical protein